MRIGIVTQPLSRNYGGILQNYALQQTLIKLGHTPYTFDLGAFTWKDWAVVSIKTIIKKLLGRKCHFPQTPTQRKSKEKPLRAFVQQRISLISPRLHKLSADKIKEYNLDAVIVGSDQVWRPMYNYNIEDMFLSFAQDLNIKRLAYASSFGAGQWEYSDIQTKNCKVLAQKFDAISVREESGVDLCRSYLGVNAVHMIDPTMLLTSDKYKELISHIPQSNTQYLFAYILDQTNENINYVMTCAENLGLDVVIKGAGEKLSKDDSIENWLVNFRDARYIITDSFHGSVFSIIFNKPFIALGNKSRGMERFYTLLSMYGLEDRLIDSIERKINSFVNPEWNIVNAKYDAYREEAIQFLTSNL